MKNSSMTQENVLPLIRGSWYIADIDGNDRLVLSDSFPRNECLWDEDDVREHLNKSKTNLNISVITFLQHIAEYPKLNQYSSESYMDRFHLDADRFSYSGNYWIAPSIGEQLSKTNVSEALEIDGFLWLVKYRDTRDRNTNPVYGTSVIARDEKDLREFFHHPSRASNWWLTGYRPIQERALEAGVKLAPKIIFTGSAIDSYHADIKEHEDRKAREDLARQFSRW